MKQSLYWSQTGDEYTVSVWNRSYRLASGMLASVRSCDTDLLAGSVRLTGLECGLPLRMETAEMHLMEPTDPNELVCIAALQSRYFIFDIIYRFYEDGLIKIDLSVMPRGQSVAQVFGLAETQVPDTLTLERLYLEIPLAREQTTLFRLSPFSDYHLGNGQRVTSNLMNTDGFIPPEGLYCPFKCLTFFGDTAKGLCWFCESDENWQPESSEKAIEVFFDGDAVVTRYHLLDRTPDQWSALELPGRRGIHCYLPIKYSFGVQATPVKELPANPFTEHIFHIDCFTKVDGEYLEVLLQYRDEDGGNGFDRLKRLGVTTLVLHEKWNQIQNYWKLTRETAEQARAIVRECHARGIKVVPYFGYEMSTLSDFWFDHSETCANERPVKNYWAWYRQPPQRDYRVCMNSAFTEHWLQGVTELLDRLEFDGIYLDSTADPAPCINQKHGCGYEKNGKVYPTYPVLSVREVFRRLHDILAPKGKTIDCHISGYCNIPAMYYMDSLYTGENIQSRLLDGRIDSVPVDYMQAAYNIANTGLPMQFVSYNAQEGWTFENAIALTLVHGILPRPNDIGAPLAAVAKIWRILDAFPIAKSVWQPYWCNRTVTADCASLRVSCYVCGGEILVIMAELEENNVDGVLHFGGKYTAVDCMTGQTIGESIDRLPVRLDKYGYRILRLTAARSEDRK